MLKNKIKNDINVLYCVIFENLFHNYLLTSYKYWGKLPTQFGVPFFVFILKIWLRWQKIIFATHRQAQAF